MVKHKALVYFFANFKKQKLRNGKAWRFELKFAIK